MDIPLLNSLFRWIEKICTPKYSMYLLVLLVCVFAIPHTRPRVWHNNAWDAVMLKSQDLTNPLTDFPPSSNPAKRVFRLTVPIVIKVFHLNSLGVDIIQFILGYLLIIFAHKLSIRILKDAVAATFIAFGLLFTFFGNISFWDTRTAWFDGWSFFFLVMALFQRNLFGIFFFATCAAWNDERAFLALPVVLLFHQIDKEQTPAYNIKALIFLNRKSIAVLAAIIGYVAGRVFLQAQFGMHTPLGEGSGVSLSLLRQHLYLMPFGTWTFLEGFWLLFLVFILFALTNKDYFLLTLILGLTIILTAIAGCVLDITRSGAYLMPVIFVLASYLKNYMDIQAMKYLLLFVMTVCIIFPPYFVMKWESDIYFMGFPIIIELPLKLLHVPESAMRQTF